MTLPAFAAERRAAAPLLLSVPAAGTRRRRLLSIDIFCQRGAQQQTRCTPLLLLNDGTDGRADRRTDAHRFVDPAPRDMRARGVVVNFDLGERFPGPRSQ